MEQLLNIDNVVEQAEQFAEIILKIGHKFYNASVLLQRPAERRRTLRKSAEIRPALPKYA